MTYFLILFRRPCIDHVLRVLQMAFAILFGPLFLPPTRPKIRAIRAILIPTARGSELPIPSKGPNTEDDAACSHYRMQNVPYQIMFS
jgi:hypothetical protein